MSDDHIRYDLLVREALRGVVRRVVADAAKNGLPGEHHFFISFHTGAPGVRISSRMRAQYPQEMTIVLQHQFWDLAATDVGIEVGLSFNGVPEKLGVPYEAIKGFFDPSVKFGLEFEVEAEKVEGAASDPAPVEASPSAPKVPAPNLPASSPATEPERSPAPGRIPRIKRQDRAEAPAETAGDKAQAPSPAGPPATDGGAEVVRLDRFRKK
jgi:hypothetical protein